MTVRQILDELALVKPHAYPDEELMHWLTHHDGVLCQEVLSNYPDTRETLPPTYTSDTQELMLKPPYTMMYLLYLLCVVDYMNGDIASSNNHDALWQTQYEIWADAMSRGHRAETVPLSVLS